MNLMEWADGMALAENGAQRAADHADRVTEGWSDMAFAHALTFIAALPDGQTFTTEQVRSYATKEGFPLPPDSRAWGQVALRLLREGRIERAGYGRSQERNKHSCPTILWKAVQL